MLIDARCKSVAGSNKSRSKWFGLTEHFTEHEWLDLLIRSGYKCASCGKSSADVALEADHVIPLARGGSNTIDNIQVLCKSCNCSKNAKAIDFRNGASDVIVVSRNAHKKSRPVKEWIAPKESTSKIVLRLKEVSVSKGLSQSQLSLQAQVGLGVVRRYWDSDTTSVDLNVLDKFCEALNCRPCDLIDRVDNASAN